MTSNRVFEEFFFRLTNVDEFTVLDHRHTAIGSGKYYARYDGVDVSSDYCKQVVEEQASI